MVNGVRPHFDSLTRSHNLLQEEAEHLLLCAGIDQHKGSNYTKTDLEKLQEFLAEYQIKVFKGNTSMRPWFSGPYVGSGPTKVLNLRLVDGHYDHIKRIARFFNKEYWCDRCNASFDHLERHYLCPVRCHRCWHLDTTDCVADGVSLECPDCKMKFRSSECLARHKRSPTSFARLSKTACRTNRSIVRGVDDVEDDGDDAESIDDDAQRYMSSKHKVNLLIALKCCSGCQDMLPRSYDAQSFGDCATCGPSSERLKTWHSFDSPRCNPVRGFIEWLMAKGNKGYTAIAHNLKGYDGQFLLNEVLRVMQDLEPDAESTDEEEATDPFHDNPVLVGRKLYAMKIGGARLVDSLNFIPSGLNTFPKHFGLSELKKGFFPYLFNTPANYAYVGPVPPVQFYDPRSMSTKKRGEFERWHRDQVQGPDPAVFAFVHEAKAYCFSDVILHAQGCIAFSKNFETTAGVSPFVEATTAASTAMLTYRRMGLPRDKLIIDRPENLKLRQSKEALVLLDWLALKDDMECETHAILTIGPYFVDALVRTPERPEPFVFAVIITCIHAVTPMKIKCTEYRHEKSATVTEDASAQSRLPPPIRIRNSFRGGRVECIHLGYRAPPGWSILYFDFCSLYPSVQKYCRYPTGGMRTVPGADLPQHITNPDELVRHVDGFLYCKVRPPSSGYLPVLPLTISGKLKFAFCARCAKLSGKGAQRAVRYRLCPHTDAQREFEGTFATVELQLALRKGYTIVAAYEQQGVGDLASGEARGESSGWPAWADTDAKKCEYLDMWRVEEGLALDASKIDDVPSARSVAKLLLNSLWGKFGEQANKKKTVVTNEYDKFMDIMENSAFDIKDIVIIPGSDRAKVTYAKVEDDVEPLGTNSIAVASLTTAYARCRLYEALECIPESNLLYCDTDSVIFAQPDDEPNPLGSLIGSTLGRMTDELEGQRCFEFICQGPKVYALKYRKEGADPGAPHSETVKCRGFPLSSEAAEIVNFRAISRNVEGIVNEDAAVEPSKVPVFRMEVDRVHEITSRTAFKRFGAVFDKRIIAARAAIRPRGPPGSPSSQGYGTYPFGYRG